jgi:hypothetical protein
VDEFQELLRKCDYQAGDAIVLLGDLVAKGPDSCGVVQMVNPLDLVGPRPVNPFARVWWWGRSQAMTFKRARGRCEELGVGRIMNVDFNRIEGVPSSQPLEACGLAPLLILL